MGNNLIVLKGCSCGGKSSRVQNLIDRLPGEAVIDYCHLQKGDFYFVGRYNKYGNWQGADIALGKLKNQVQLTQYIYNLTLIENSTVIVEGAATTLSWRWRPLYLEFKFQHVDRFDIIYINFEPEQYSLYCERNRLETVKDTGRMWAKNKGFTTELGKCYEEQPAMKNPGKVNIVTLAPESPLDSFTEYLMSEKLVLI